MDLLKGWKSQATAILGALFVIFNVFYPDMFTAEEETQIITGIVSLFALFVSMKMARNGNGGE